MDVTFILSFFKVTTPEEFWAWTKKILLPTLYPSFWYNGWKMKYLDRQFPLYTEAFRIGPPRLTQIREAVGMYSIGGVLCYLIVKEGL